MQWSLQIQPDSLSDDVPFGFIPTDTGLESMHLQPHEGANRQRDMVHLRPCRPNLRLLDAATLLEASVVGLNGPRPLGPRLKLADSHLQVVGCPVLRVSVCRDRPKHLDEPIALEMHPPAFRFDGNRADRHVAAPIGVDLSVGLEARQPRPIVGANPLEVVEGSIPAIEHHALGLKAARLGTGQHRPEVLVLVVAPDRLVIDAEVAGNASEAVRPDHTYEIDAQDHPVMFAAPMARHQFDPAWHRACPRWNRPEPTRRPEG